MAQIAEPTTIAGQANPADIDLDVLRRPGLLEQFSTIRHAIGFYKTVGNVVRYHPPPETDLTPARLYAALHSVVAAHASLAISILDEPSSISRFVRLPSLDLRQIVTFESVETPAARDQALNDVLERRLSSSYDGLGRLPLWRLLVLVPPETAPQSELGVDVALFIHHSIADGGSLTTFHNALLAALTAAPPDADPADPGPIIQIPKLDLLPPLESLLALPISLPTLLRVLWRQWFPPSAKARWTGPSVTRPGPTGVRTQHAFSTLDPAAARALLRACKAHATSVTALLEAVLARALFAALPAADGTANELVCACAIDLRRFMDPSCADAMGVFVASDEHTFHRASTSASASASVWTDAVRVKAALNAKLAKRNRDTNTGFLRYVSDVRAYFEKNVGKKRGVSFEVTNVGVVDGGEEGRWRMSRMMFTQSASVTGAAVQFSVSSVKGGALCVCATWQEALVERTFVEGVLRGYEQLVEDITKEG